MSKSINQWLDEYAESHRNPTNKLIHWICVPLIVFSIVGALITIHPYLMLLVFVCSTIYFFMLSPKLALGLLPVTLVMLYLAERIAYNSSHPYMIFIGIFVVAWIGQFIGHHLEGKKPSFLKDVQFLMIGPLWLLSFVYKKLGLSY